MKRIGIAHRMQIVAVAAFALAWFAGDASADMVTLVPARDATLIESTTGNFANGSGPALFAGRIAASSQFLRRSVLAFDVAGAVPRGSTVISVRLAMNVSSTNPGPAEIRLHRVLADWGEGASFATGGGGAPALPGDTTWLHRFYDDTLWTHPGGDFDPSPRAATIVEEAGPCTWGPTPAMAADVQSWLDDPAHAFGWIVLGDESRPQTVRRFDSREAPDWTLRPALEIEYEPPCVPLPLGPGAWRLQCSDRETIAPILDCAARRLRDLGLPDVDPCGGAGFDAPRGCDERALGGLSLLLLNLCAGRLQTSCPVPPAEGLCESDTLGERLREAATLATEGECRRAFACVAGTGGL